MSVLQASKTYEAILFDMDGVITDTHQAITDFWYDLAAVHHIQLTDSIFDQHIYGVPARYTYEKVFPNLTPEDIQAVDQQLIEYEANLTYAEIPGVTTFLRRLKQLNFPFALVTSGNTHKAEAVTGQLGIADLFEVKVTADHVRNGKPAPECYQMGAKHLGKSPEKCIVFEDVANGVKAGVSAGATVVGVCAPRYADSLLKAGASYTIPNFTGVELVQQPYPGLRLNDDVILPLNIKPTADFKFS
jgi:HAD superfamily hydrolase (TIGR01509 family)